MRITLLDKFDAIIVSAPVFIANELWLYECCFNGCNFSGFDEFVARGWGYSQTESILDEFRFTILKSAGKYNYWNNFYL